MSQVRKRLRLPGKLAKMCGVCGADATTLTLGTYRCADHDTVLQEIDAAVIQNYEPIYSDPIHHPKHYTSHPSGVECIRVTEHFNFNVGNAIKYLWRAGLKSPDQSEDLRKAEWYVKREIERLTKEKKP